MERVVTKYLSLQCALSLAVRAQVNIEPGTELSMALTLGVTTCDSVGDLTIFLTQSQCTDLSLFVVWVSY